MKAKIVVLITLLLCACVSAQGEPFAHVDPDVSPVLASEPLVSEPPVPSIYKQVSISEVNQAIQAYEAFLRGDIPATYYGKETFLGEIYYPEGDERYFLLDMNSDGIPELHFPVNCYYIFTYANDGVALWYAGASYETPLVNGAMFYRRGGGAPEHVNYAYIVLNYYGNEVFRLDFSEWHSDLEIMPGDFYYFDDVELPKGQWEQLTSRYLAIGDAEIEWHFLEP